MSLKFVPFLLALASASACGTNNDKTKDHLRNEIELKDRQTNLLQEQVTVSQKSAEQARLDHEKALSESNEKVKNLSLDVDAKTVEVARLEQEVADKKAKIASVETSIAEKTAAIEDLEKSVKESKAEQASLSANLEAEKAKAASEKTALEGDLAAKKAELLAAQNTLNASAAKEAELNASISSLSADLVAKTEEVKKLDEKIAALETNEPQNAINDLMNKLEDTKKELASLKDAKGKMEVELAKNTSVLVKSMAPLKGMYFSRRSTLSFHGSTCRLYVYVQPKGESVSAVVCEDGRMQFEQRGVVSFSAVNDKKLDGGLAFKMTADKGESSCKGNESTFVANLSYAFDRGSRIGIADFAPSLSLTFNNSSMILDSAALDFTNSKCENLEALQASQAISTPNQKARLDGAVRVCKMIAAPRMEIDADANVGCFMANDAFVK